MTEKQYDSLRSGDWVLVRIGMSWRPGILVPSPRIGGEGCNWVVRSREGNTDSLYSPRSVAAFLENVRIYEKEDVL